MSAVLAVSEVQRLGVLRACAIGPLRLELVAAPVFAHFVDALLDRYTDSTHGPQPLTPDYWLRVELIVGTPKSARRESFFTNGARVLTDASSGWDAKIHFSDRQAHAVFALRDQTEFGPDGELFMARWVAGAVRVALALVAPHFGAVLVHGAAISLGASAVVLLGSSGAGKTTMARRFERALSDDATLVFPAPSGAWCALGTPVPGREGLPLRGEVTPLAALVHLLPNQPLALTPLSVGEALAALLKRVLYFAAPTEALFTALHSLAQRVPSYTLASTLADDVTPHLTAILRGP